MIAIIDELRLEGSVEAFLAHTSVVAPDAGLATSLAIVLGSGSFRKELAEVTAATQTEGGKSRNCLVLAEEVVLPLLDEDHLAVSIFARRAGDGANEEQLLVAEALLSLPTSRQSLVTMRWTLEWHANSQLWVAHHAAGLEDDPQQVLPGACTPALVLRHRIANADTPLVSSDQAILHVPAASEEPLVAGVSMSRTPADAVNGRSEREQLADTTDGPHQVTPDHNGGLSTPRVAYGAGGQVPSILNLTLAHLCVAGFDPKGWLQSDAMPRGIGEHTIMEVLNLFLEGVAEQLGIVARPEWAEIRASKNHAAARRGEFTEAGAEAAAGPSATSRSKPAGTPPHARQFEVGPSAAQLERELSKLREALVQKDATIERQAMRCAEFTRRLEAAEREIAEVQARSDQMDADVSAYKRRLAGAQEENKNLRTARGDSPHQPLLRMPDALLYCVRSAVRQALLSVPDEDVPVLAERADPAAAAKALSRHIDWLWRALRSIWDVDETLKETLADVQRTPHAIASLASTGEPPWPGGVLAPREREAQQLLDFLRKRALGTALQKRADDAEADAAALRSELAETQMERDMAKQVNQQAMEEMELFKAAVEDASKRKAEETLQETLSPVSSPGARRDARRSRSKAIAVAQAEEWIAEQEAKPSLASSQLTADLHYPGDVQLHALEYEPMFTHLATANASQRAYILRLMEDVEFLRTLLEVYQDCDVTGKGHLAWRHYQVQDFVVAAFRRFLLSPPSAGLTYRLFTKFDVHRRMTLEARSCICLVDAMFRIAFFRPPRRSMAPAESWVMESGRLITEGSVVCYRVGVRLSFADIISEADAEDLVVSGLDATVASSIQDALADGSLARSFLQYYKRCDQDLRGFLLWRDGEVLDFITLVFAHKGLGMPGEALIRRVYEAFAGEDFVADDNGLDALDCVWLADAVLRMVTQHTLLSRVSPAATSPAAAPTAPGTISAQHCEGVFEPQETWPGHAGLPGGSARRHGGLSSRTHSARGSAPQPDVPDSLCTTAMTTARSHADGQRPHGWNEATTTRTFVGQKSAGPTVTHYVTYPGAANTCASQVLPFQSMLPAAAAAASEEARLEAEARDLRRQLVEREEKIRELEEKLSSPSLQLPPQLSTQSSHASMPPPARAQASPMATTCSWTHPHAPAQAPQQPAAPAAWQCSPPGYVLQPASRPAALSPPPLRYFSVPQQAQAAVEGPPSEPSAAPFAANTATAAVTRPVPTEALSRKDSSGNVAAQSGGPPAVAVVPSPPLPEAMGGLPNARWSRAERSLSPLPPVAADSRRRPSTVLASNRSTPALAAPMIMSRSTSVGPQPAGAHMSVAGPPASTWTAGSPPRPAFAFGAGSHHGQSPRQ
eukprot:TRINITY_DN32795_c0_g1_i3.p1 TRINITY_DN32795_c0_g1~~TRINITY_DN32795_c0_g1_i3.p1  ORF type:complete len:1365 (-),score=261.66 TRINITY_DN32795_c0_g1_i3:124-4218(-)